MRETIFAANINRTSKSRWDAVVNAVPYSSYRMFMEYIETRMGDLNYFVFSVGNKDVAAVCYQLKSIVPGLLRGADTVSGVAIVPGFEEIVLPFMIKHYIEWAKKEKLSYIRLNSWIPIIIAGDESLTSALLYNNLIMNGFESISSGRHTYWIKLTKTEDDLLAGMKKQTRYEVRKGLSSSLEVKIYETAEDNQIQQFWELYSKLGAEKEFGILTQDRFYKEINNLLQSKIAVLFVISYGDVIVNMAVCSVKGNGHYIFGAMNPLIKKMKECPSPGPLAQWAMITYLKAKGIANYDMGFCPGPEPFEGHPKFNIWRFKFGFGGDYVRYSAVYGLKLHNIRGKLIERFIKQ